MTIKDLIFMLVLMAIIAIALAIDSIMTALPLIFLAAGASTSLVIFTVTSCAIRYRRWQLEQYKNLYVIESQGTFKRIAAAKSKLLDKFD